jgi:hypothetical protein
VQGLRSKGRGRGGSSVKDNMRLDKSVTNNDLGNWKARKVSRRLGTGCSYIESHHFFKYTPSSLLLLRLFDCVALFLPNNLARGLRSRRGVKDSVKSPSPPQIQ